MYNVKSVSHIMQEGQKSHRDKALFLQHICREGKQLSQQHINQHLLVINLFSEGREKNTRLLWRGGMQRQDTGDRPEISDR